MATKQHCDICDSVIPGDESFRVIRYGRGQNYDVQTGNDPKIICKACWAKMWAAVSTEEARNIDDIGKTFLSKAEAKRYKQAIDKNSDAINDIHKIIKSAMGGKDDIDKTTLKGCTSCQYVKNSSNEGPCSVCLGYSEWTPKEGEDKETENG
jgi:hypothetical protein